MEQKKNINIKIKKSTLNFIGKNLLLVLCCFILAISYPFLNIHFSEITHEISFPYKPYYNSYSDVETQYYMQPLFEQDKKLIPTYLSNQIKTNLKSNGAEIVDTPKLSTTIDFIFGIKEYRSIFNYVFYPLLIIGILIMNFKFNFKIKDE